MTDGGGWRPGSSRPPASWRKSSYSDNLGNCVEVTAGPGGVALRDSKNPRGQGLLFSASTWHVFIHGTRSGEFDLG
ncbi:protein of unknown function (DUF397) [Streptoalloteichus tenebrarius]|uniref:DUF397 domain-containing protein n=1 Tax=Streptoalloteichus tenebrarius (strain ATCC 17920 / DSM 40477 / JCM 4838 / CBS 697.72 / NBRC 16177 / NCIMB 11028 / NRRL B-12390 / A12253. 1 / ISP 5477) TaxID=1933 RepID=A0ABT1HZT3_STRSD|nr:DUF397 domain-containing protein [Streptoalloteichus tenebrarius]MCP2261048.1 protein of unknown function (DUF397) [Streptoalloteichus tenebrarius]BFF03158.1 DUF397 domain-containing protein [Streptoalloteichus tenebrarius]